MSNKELESQLFAKWIEHRFKKTTKNLYQRIENKNEHVYIYREDKFSIYEYQN